MFSFRILSQLILAAAVLAINTSCHNSSVLDVPGQNHTALLSSPVSASSQGGAGFTVAAGTTVTSNSVVNGQVILGVQDLPGFTSASFDGTVYGGAIFTPTDATFSAPIELSIPVEGVIGSPAVYYAGPGSSASQAGFSLLSANVQVSNGKVTLSSTKFGTYIVGRKNLGHNEGAGGSL